MIENLPEILRLHKLWMNDEDCGTRAVLKGADLRGADLTRADLTYADLKGAKLYVIHAPEWTITIQPELITIGCQRHTPEEWWGFTDEQIGKMHGEALPWWQINKPLVRASWDAVMVQVEQDKAA